MRIKGQNVCGESTLQTVKGWAPVQGSFYSNSFLAYPAYEPKGVCTPQARAACTWSSGVGQFLFEVCLCLISKTGKLPGPGDMGGTWSTLLPGESLGWGALTTTLGGQVETHPPERRQGSEIVVQGQSVLWS